MNEIEKKGSHCSAIFLTDRLIESESAGFSQICFGGRKQKQKFFLVLHLLG